MTDPTRLLQTRLDTAERRAIEAAMFDEPPGGAQARIWDALAVALPAAGVLAGATTATSIASATSAASATVASGTASATAASGTTAAVGTMSAGVTVLGTTAVSTTAATMGVATVAGSGLGLVASKAIAIGIGVGVALNAATGVMTQQFSTATHTDSTVASGTTSTIRHRGSGAKSTSRQSARARTQGTQTPTAGAEETQTEKTTAERRMQQSDQVTQAASGRATLSMETNSAIATVTGIERRIQPTLDSLTDESSMLARARLALLGGDAAAASATIDEHRRRFPTSTLAQERDALAVLVHARAGHTDTARALAAAFLERYPSSPHAEKMRSIVRGASL